MGLYSKHIFPRILDWSLNNAMMREQRREALAPLGGHVLEIGFGTALNLPHYPAQVTRLTAIDNEQMLRKRVAQRIIHARFPVEIFQLDAGGRLPFEADSFDGVASTLTLCSIPEVASALAEIRRVLKPTGSFVFLEHGRSDDPKVARSQDRFNPIQKFVGRGCNLNRRIDQLIKASGLNLVKLDRFLLPDTPRLLGEMYRGVAMTD